MDRCSKSSDGNHIYKPTDLVSDNVILGHETIYVCMYCENLRTFNNVKKEWK